MNVRQEAERLSQAKFLAFVRQDFPPTAFLPVWWWIDQPEHVVTLFCALVPNSKIDETLEQPTWDLGIGDGTPDAIRWGSGGKESRIEYDRFGGNGGIEPLIFCREFHSLRPSYVEVSEEFRLFHNLYHDRPTNRYIKYDRAGNEIDVISTETDRVLIRLHEIKQFLAAKDMHLALYFDNRERSCHTLAELGATKGGEDVRHGLIVYGLYYSDFGAFDDFKASSRLLGKRLLPPYPKQKSGLWAFTEDERRELVKFIIRVDETGGQISGATDAHGGGVEYLTPIFFRRAVLDKYYHQPTKYSVEDGYLRCGSLWGMAMDNHHDDYIVAWLGDLGRDLPHEEQLHWRSHNIAPCGRVSNVFFRRQLGAEFAESDQPDIQFQLRYPQVCDACKKRLGWSVFLPLTDKDRHCFDSLRIPASDEQKEFDDLVGALAKVLIDSLNEAELTKLLDPANLKKDMKGISRLEAVLIRRNATGYEPHIQFLRDLQELRSTGSAHRKGGKYEKLRIRFGMDTETLPQVFRKMLSNSLRLTDFVQELVAGGCFDRSGSSATS